MRFFEGIFFLQSFLYRFGIVVSCQREIDEDFFLFFDDMVILYKIEKVYYLILKFFEVC